MLFDRLRIYRGWWGIHPQVHICKVRQRFLKRLLKVYPQLGTLVSLSTNLNFNTHIKRISSNANKSLGFIKINIKTKHSDVHEAAYKTFVRPQYDREYVSTVWSPHTQTYCHKIEMVQPFAGPLTTTLHMTVSVKRFLVCLALWLLPLAVSC